MDSLNIYPSRVILVGEYGELAGGSALTIPFKKFHIKVGRTTHIPPGKEKEVFQSVRILKELHQFICDLPEGSFHAPPDLVKFSDHLEYYWLETTIPTGYGLGSSGAISAAIYDLFFPESRNVSLSLQKDDLTLIESHFHKQSEGIDPLTCFVGTPLYTRQDGTLQKVDFDPARIQGDYRFFLLDSGERFDTGSLIKHFLDQMEIAGFASSIRKEYLIINQKLIETLLGHRIADPGMLVRVLSDYQFTHFRKMIPANMLDLWIEGQVSGEFYLKLNGWGGGFIMGITHQTSMEALEERWKTDLIWI
jgi:mevalonate kinase